MNSKFFNIIIVIFILQLQVDIAQGNSETNIPPPWNPTNTGSNHTILIPDFIPVTLNGLSIDSGDYIGVFFDSLGTLVCGGYIMWQNSTTAIAAWGEDSGNDGFAINENFKWKIWDSSIGKDYNATASFNGEDFPNYDYYVSNGMSGLTSLKAYSDHIIDLHQGWNFFTSYITPLQPEWSNIFDSIGSLIIVNKTFDDSILWPEQSKTISEFSSAESYKIKVAEDLSLIFWGNQLQPEDTSFVLSPIFQPLPYIRTNAASVDLLLSNIYNDIKLIKSEDGLLFWPEMNTTQLVNFYPGKAYQIKVYNTVSYTFPPNNNIIDISENIYSSGQFYNPELNTGNNMSLGILNSSWNIILSLGDEIGVFSEEGRIAGAGFYNGQNIGITIWGDDETTEIIEGINESSPFNLKLRYIDTGFEDIIIIKSWLEGDSIYQKDKISVIDEVEIKQDEDERTYNLEIIPIYSQGLYRLVLSVPEQSQTDINLFDLNGKFVKNLFSNDLPTGKYIFDVYLNELSSGIYFFRMETSKKDILRKIPILN